MNLNLLPFYFLTDSPHTEIYTLSLHDALPILQKDMLLALEIGRQLDVPLPTTAISNEFLTAARGMGMERSEEHTSELQSRFDLVCRLLLEKKKRGVNRGKILNAFKICSIHSI